MVVCCTIGKVVERKESYEKSGTTLSYVAQAISFLVRKAEIPALRAVRSQVLQDVATRLDQVFSSLI